MPMALFSPPLPPTFASSCAKTQVPQRPLLALVPRRGLSLFVVRSADNGTGAASSAVVEEKSETKEGARVTVAVEEEEEEGKGKKKSEGLGSNNGASVKLAAAAAEAEVPKFKDPRWVEGTWDLKQFKKDGSTDWDAVIDAEARRRKWLEENPEASSTDDPVLFDTSIIPWWAWIKRFHLPEAERLNGRAAMIGFFMAYFVDSLTGVGLVDQMGNFFCKSLLFISVAGVLLIRKNEDIETLKKLIEETTFYDKQWQATWQDKNASETSKE